MSKECQGGFIGMVITPKDFIHRLNVRTTMWKYSCRYFIFGSDDHVKWRSRLQTPVLNTFTLNKGFRSHVVQDSVIRSEMERVWKCRKDLWNQWRIQGRGPGPLLFLDQTETRRRAEKIFLGDRPPFLSKGPPPPPPPPPPQPLISSSGYGTGSRLTLLFKIRGACKTLRLSSHYSR